MSDTKRLLSYIRRAVDDYSMIEEGDRVAVGVSGGKDSLALLTGLAALSRFYPKKFSLLAVTVDIGLPDTDFSAVEEYCRGLGVEYRVLKTEISKIIFDVRKELERYGIQSFGIDVRKRPAQLAELVGKAFRTGSETDIPKIRQMCGGTFNTGHYLRGV